MHVCMPEEAELQAHYVDLLVQTELISIRVQLLRDILKRLNISLVRLKSNLQYM